MRGPTGRLQAPGALGAREVLHRGRRRHLGRGGHVDQSMALRGRSAVGQLVGCTGEQTLYLVRGQLGSGREQQRRGAGSHGRGLGGATPPDQAVARAGCRAERVVDERAGGVEAGQVRPWCDQVRVAHSVAAGGEAGHSRRLTGRVCRADRQDVGIHGRIAQAMAALALVPRRHDNHDAGMPGLLGGVRQRVDAVVLARVGAERQVQDADVEPVGVGVLHHPVDAGDHLRHVGVAPRVRHLDAHEASPRRYATEAAGPVLPRDDPGEVRPVPEPVEMGGRGLLRVERQVRAVYDLVARQARYGSDARVDQGHVHPVTPGAARPQVAGADVVGHRAEALGGAAALVVRVALAVAAGVAVGRVAGLAVLAREVHPCVAGHGDDPGVTAKPGCVVGVELHDVCVDEPDLSRHGTEVAQIPVERAELTGVGADDVRRDRAAGRREGRRGRERREAGHGGHCQCGGAPRPGRAARGRGAPGPRRALQHVPVGTCRGGAGGVDELQRSTSESAGNNLSLDASA